MIKTVFKAHPIMAVRLIKPYLFVLILPLVRAVIQYFISGEVNGLLALELITLAFIILLAVLGWRSISITVRERYITVKKGFLIKSCAVIELSRISCISLKQNIFDLIFKSVSCQINTEAGTPQKSDFDIKLSKADAKRLYSMVYGEEDMKTIRFSPLRIALLAATVSSAATGIIIGVPVINRASDLLGLAISDMLLDEINNVSSKFNSIFPPIVNTITVILLISYGISFAVCFIKHLNFKLKSGSNSIQIQSGLIAKRKTVFKKSKVNNICFEQTLLMRIIKKHSMRVSVGGYGDRKSEKAIIVPVARYNELKEQLKIHFPFFKSQGKSVAPTKNKFNLNRFLYIPALLALLTIGVGLSLIIIFPFFDRLVLFLTVIVLCIDLYYGSICYYGYKYGQVKIGEYILASGSTGLTVRELYCDKNKIGVIKIIQTPADRRFKTCKVKFVVRSELADSVRVKNLNTNLVIEQINKEFNLNISE